MLINGLKARPKRTPPSGAATRWTAPYRHARTGASPADAVMAVEAAAEAFRTWGETGPGERRAAAARPPTSWRPRRRSSSRPWLPRPGPPAWGRFQRDAGRRCMIREARSPRRSGEVIPSGRAGAAWLWASSQPASVVLGIAPGTPIILGVRAICVPAACKHVILGRPELPAAPPAHCGIVPRTPVSAGVVNFNANAPPMPALWWRP